MAKTKRRHSFIQPPGSYEFTPTGGTARSVPRIVLSMDEYEALRLVDYEELDLASAAGKLDLTRSTCERTVVRARKKIAEALSFGKSIVIEGAVTQASSRFRCGTCGYLWSETDPIEPEDARCPRCNGSRVIDLAATGGYGRY